jgi:branched-chain amino acid transport system substrate-binding protein
MARTVFAALLAAVLLTALVAPAGAQPPIKIGFHAGLTGPAAADGVSGRMAADLAMDQINKGGGINGRKIELVVYDDGGKPEQVVPLANKLIGDDKVRAVVSTGFSGPTKAAAPVFQEAGIPYVVSIALQPDITKAGNYVFRIASMGEVQGRAGAKVVGDMLKKKRVVLITIKTDFGKTLAVGFKEAAPKFGVDIVKEYEYSPQERQFGPLVASVKADQPDAIYASGFYFTGGPLVSQLRGGGVTAPLVGPESYSTHQFVEIAGPAAEGVVITNVIDWASKHPQELAFLSDWEKKAGFKAEAVGAQTYTAMMVLADALRRAGSDDPKKIREALAATNLRTAIGQVSFNNRREVRKAFPVSVVKNGQWTAWGVVDDMVLLAPPAD